MTFSRLLILIN